MPIPLFALAKGAHLVKTASGVLADWNRLAPEERALVRQPALEVVQGLNELRRSVGHRLFGDDETSWEEAHEIALDPSIGFLLAKQVVDVVQRERHVSHDEMVRAVGAAGANDGVLEAALNIAEDDGYIRAEGDGWHVTDFADGQLLDAEHIVYLEQAIVEYVEDAGLVGRDALAKAVGAASSESGEFRAALERCVASATVHWLENGLYGVAPERLAHLQPPTEDDVPDAAREVKDVVADLARAVDRLRTALADVRHPERRLALPAETRQLTTAAADQDPLERIGKLKQLLDAGALSEQEFREQKTRLLAAI